jgi:hypothetical protein
VLARTLSGAALPVGQLEVRQYCKVSGDATPLATLAGGSPLLSRVPTEQGAVYFWATTPSPRDSSLASSGVVLYAFVQRALATGAAQLSKARQIDAGVDDNESASAWVRLSEEEQGLSTESRFQRGVYSAGDRLLAVNRPVSEDNIIEVADGRVSGLFRGLDFARVDEQAGNLNALIQEIWRVFLVMMLIALVLEAALCLPKVARTAGATA